MKKYILAIDEGTTGTTALLINKENLKIIGVKNLEFKQYYPSPGFVEHDLNEIWNKVNDSISNLLNEQNIKGEEILGIGITNQRETTCAFNSKGSPLHHAIVWQDRRTSDFCNAHKENFNNDLKNKTGLPLDPYFSGTKMRWLLENSNEVQEARNNNDLFFGTIDTFLVFKMTNGESFVTEPSNASRTLLMDLHSTSWDDELLDFFGIRENELPKIKDSFANFGTTKNMTSLPDGIPILSILGDQQAALFGQGCVEEGQMKCTYGTGAFLLLNTGKNIQYSNHGLLTTVAYRFNDKTYYALEGSTYIAGAAVQFLRDNLKFLKASPDIERYAQRVEDLNQMKDLIFFPFFTGIGTPYWSADAKGALIGMTRGTDTNHICRATLEGIAFSVNDSVNSLINDSPNSVNEIRVDGGASLNNFLMNLQAEVSKLKIIRPEIIETTAYGVALGVLVALGEKSISDLSTLIKVDREFESVEQTDYIKHKLNLWEIYIKKNFI